MSLWISFSWWLNLSVGWSSSSFTIVCGFRMSCLLELHSFFFCVFLFFLLFCVLPLILSDNGFNFHDWSKMKQIRNQKEEEEVEEEDEWLDLHEVGCILFKKKFFLRIKKKKETRCDYNWCLFVSYGMTRLIFCMISIILFFSCYWRKDARWDLSWWRRWSWWGSWWPRVMWGIWGGTTFCILCSFFHFILRFWNQILICLSLKQRAWAISILRLRVKYRLKWNSFSNSSVWYRVYDVLCLLVSPIAFTPSVFK